jgi:3-deoxy-D-manno-octulosonic-acid transferase
VQTPEYAEQIRQLGVPAERVTVTGSVKYDGVMTERDNPKTAAFRELFGLPPAGLEDSPRGLVWVAGSTQAPEEEIVLGVFAKLRAEFPDLRLILVPRQPDRFEEVARLLGKHEFEFKRRSELCEPAAQAMATPNSLACAAGSQHSVILVDTLGELSAIWGLADVAFVGGSLDGQRGGQNMIEPAAYGAAVIFGPYVWNFRDTVHRLLSATAAIQVRDSEELEAVVRRMLADVNERRQLGEAARRLVLEQQGATARTMEVLEQVLAACGAAERAPPQAA